LVFLVLVLPLALPAGAEEQFRMRFAVVVGHNTGGHETTQLQYAEKDAEKMAALLNALGSVPAENLHALSSPTTEELRTGLAAMKARIAGNQAAHTELFFYFSGHADDAGLQLGEGLFHLDELRSFLKDSGADVTIAIIDACQSGAIVRDKGGKRVPLLDLTLGADGQASGVAIITSSAAGEKSQESDELRGSFFTHFLASGMRGDADSSRDGQVTVYELYQYAYNKTRQRTYLTGGRSQHPTFDYTMSGRGEVVVAYPDRGRSRLVLPAGLEGNYLLYSPAHDAVLAEIDKRKGEMVALAVPPGTIDIFKRTEQALHKATVEVADGETTEVPAGDMVEVSRSYLIDKGSSPYLVLGAKGGYQFFWDSQVRQRALLPSIVGGIELRAREILGHRFTPFVEVLVGGAASTDQGGTGPLAQTFSCVEAGAGMVFTLVEAPIVLEVSPAVALYYAYLAVRENQDDAAEGADHYAMASPSLSLLLGKEFGRTFTVALQVKTGYLYFKDSVSDYGRNPRHLGYSEAFLTAGLRL